MELSRGSFAFCDTGQREERTDRFPERRGDGLEHCEARVNHLPGFEQANRGSAGANPAAKLRLAHASRFSRFPDGLPERQESVGESQGLRTLRFFTQAWKPPCAISCRVLTFLTMIPNYRTSRIVVELAPELRSAVEEEAYRQTEGTHRKVTMSDVIRDLVADHLLAKKAGAVA